MTKVKKDGFHLFSIYITLHHTLGIRAQNLLYI